MSTLLTCRSPFDECPKKTFELGNDIFVKLFYFPLIPTEAELKSLALDADNIFHVYVSDVSISDRGLDLRKGREEFYFVGSNGFLVVKQETIEHDKKDEHQFTTWATTLTEELLIWVNRDGLKLDGYKFRTGFTGILISHRVARYVECKKPQVDKLAAYRQRARDLKEKLERAETPENKDLREKTIRLTTELDTAYSLLVREHTDEKREKRESLMARAETFLDEAEREKLTTPTPDSQHETREQAASCKTGKRYLDDAGGSMKPQKKQRVAKLLCPPQEARGVACG